MNKRLGKFLETACPHSEYSPLGKMRQLYDRKSYLYSLTHPNRLLRGIDEALWHDLARVLHDRLGYSLQMELMTKLYSAKSTTD